MLGLAAAIACVAIGAVLGLALTLGAVRRDFGIGAIRLGAWSIASASGTPDINPYQRAHFAGTGEIPMALGQGVSLSAVRDDGGRKLERGCSYRLTGTVPKARLWTLSVTDTNGRPLNTPLGRTAFASSEVLRNADGAFAIAIAPTVRAGNWLPLAGHGPFVLVLRLYDTSITALSTHDLRGLAVPRIEPGPCP